MFQTKVVEKIKTPPYPPPEILAVYEIIGKNIVEPDRAQMITWRMRFAGWIAKAANTHSEYVTLVAFPQQQLLHERASVSRNT